MDMNIFLRNVLAIITGWLCGSAINIGLIKTGSSIFPIKGIDPNDMEAFAEIMPSLDPEFFIFPFLAHAFGTLTGAFVAALISKVHKMKVALIIGGLFLLGGILINYMLPAPSWFTISDILIAYLPMAWIGGKAVQLLAKDSRKN